MAVDPLAELALGALDAAVAGLLPASVPAGLSRSVRILPARISGTGLGGYIGSHPEPQGP
ncbi:MAG: hypothetical protein IH608_06595, partial [Proteobacteria bacterium]|nr:hypothetical protein [Pseudomonadota bacterium]